MDLTKHMGTTKREKIETAILWAILAVLSVAAVSMAGTGLASAQQTIAPFYTNQENTNLYVKMGAGSPYSTIHLATVKACTSPNAFTVILLPGANPADTISGQTGVCAGATLIDYTAAPAVFYKGNGTGYVAQGSGGGGPPTGAAGGDLNGSNYPNPQVSGLKGVPFCAGFTPTNGQAVVYTTGGSPNPCYAASSVSGSTTLTGDVTGTGTGTIATTVGKINNVPLCTGFTPTNGQVLEYTTASAPNPCYTAVAQSSAGSVAIGQVQNLDTGVNPAQSLNPFTVQANSIIDANTFLFTDGTPYFCAGPAYCANGAFIDDMMLACLSTPTKCSAPLLLNLVTKFVAAKDGSGEFPVAISQNLGTLIFYSGSDNYHRYASGDGRIMVPQALYLYCLKEGTGSSQCTTAYTANVAAIKTAWAATPRSGSTHLYTVTPGDEFVCGQLFMEYMRNTGAVANCNVWAAIDDADMLVLAAAAGDAANVTFFTNDLALLVAGIRANLIDGGSGLLVAGTIQNVSNLDVPSSALAVFCDGSEVMAPCGILTSGQKTTIENYFKTHYSTLVNANGFILETPKVGGWTTIGTIPNTGGPPYTASSFTSTQYQGGNWTFHLSWFAYALGQVAPQNTTPPNVSTLLSTFLNGVDPGCEYFNQTSGSCNGTTPNLESPQGAKAGFDAFPTMLTWTPGGSCINLYGAQVPGSTCGGGLPTGLFVLPSGFVEMAAAGDPSPIDLGIGNVWQSGGPGFNTSHVQNRDTNAHYAIDQFTTAGDLAHGIGAGMNPGDDDYHITDRLAGHDWIHCVQAGNCTVRGISSGYPTGEVDNLAGGPTQAVDVTVSFNVIVLTQAMAFTIASGAPGQTINVAFCNNNVGVWPVTPPANVTGLVIAGVINHCETAAFVYSNIASQWQTVAVTQN